MYCKVKVKNTTNSTQIIEDELKNSEISDSIKMVSFVALIRGLGGKCNILASFGFKYLWCEVYLNDKWRTMNSSQKFIELVNVPRNKDCPFILMWDRYKNIHTNIHTDMLVYLSEYIRFSQYE